MKYQDYLDLVSQKYFKSERLQIGPWEVTSRYDEVFEMKWFATKLKNFTFISTMDRIDKGDISSYSDSCLRYALQHYKGLARGMHNGVTSFNVLVSKNVTDSAKEFAEARPPLHFSAFEMPIIVDLTKRTIHYYRETPIWGSLYYKYFREYIDIHFNI